MTLARTLIFALLLSATGCGGSDEPAPAKSACSAYGFSDRGDVRVFVVGHKQTVADAESYDSFAQSYRRHLEAIAPCLSSERPNLVVFPENATLGALLLGSRGQQARAEDSSTAAFVRILTAYNEPFSYYQDEYPTASLRQHLLMALSDVVWRALTETFAGIARDYGVWVMANADVAPASPSNDPTLITTLGDPDLPEQSSVWVADGPEVLNSAYLFDPTGELFGRTDKVFLTDPEEKDLNIDNGSFSELSVMSTPFARIGVATSRDAFYPPFMQRLSDLGANLIVQPEAFGGWAIEELPGDWLPDVFLSSGWLHQQKYGGFRHSLAPQYTGNFLDLVFDGQVHITERARPDHVSTSYIGQDPMPGWHAVGPWVVEDSGDSIEARRAALRSVGQQLLPGSGSELEDGYVDSLVAADLDLSPPAATLERDAARPESTLLAATDAGEQRNPAIVAYNDAVLVAWQDSQSGLDALWTSASSDGGQSFGAAQPLSKGVGPARKPALCVGADGSVTAVWQEGHPEQLVAATAPAIGESFGAPAAVAPGGASQWAGGCGVTPAGDLHVVWTDVSTGVPHVMLSRRPSGAAAFEPAFAVDASTAALPRVAGAQAEPAISADGAHIVWLDYRDRSWDVYAARWDGGALSAGARIDGAPLPDERERLNGEPRVAALGERVLVTWTDLRERRGHPDIALVQSTDGGVSFSSRRTVPGGPAEAAPVSSGGPAWPRYQPDVVLDAGGATLVFQYLSPKKSAVFRAPVSADGAAGAGERLDDTKTSKISLTRPRAARAGSSLVVVWEDDRDGATRIATCRTN